MADDKQTPPVEREKMWKIYAALQYLPLNCSPRDVLEVLVWLGHWDASGRYTCFPSQEEIARRKYLSAESIPKAVRILENRHFISKRTWGKGKEYSVNVALIMEMARREKERLLQIKEERYRRESEKLRPLDKPEFPPVEECLGVASQGIEPPHTPQESDPGDSDPRPSLLGATQIGRSADSSTKY